MLCRYTINNGTSYYTTISNNFQLNPLNYRYRNAVTVGKFQQQLLQSNHSHFLDFSFINEFLLKYFLLSMRKKKIIHKILSLFFFFFLQQFNDVFNYIFIIFIRNRENLHMEYFNSQKKDCTRFLYIYQLIYVNA